jgi:phospholipid/cholesterol/gamma-HCH transport system substrate-binding protein
MTAYRRNLLVGITVLGALVMLGWMILKFGDRPARLFATPSMPVTFMTDRADGLGEGSNITYRGVIVGKVNVVRRTEDGKEVLIDAQLDRSPPLPTNMFGEITMVSALGGTSTMVLQITGPEPTGALQPGATLKAHFVGLQFLPPEFGDLARELRATAQQFRESQVVLHLDEQVKKAGDVLDSANKLIGDPKLREDVKTAMSNIRQASETINRIGGKLDKLSDDASTTMGDVRTTVKQVGGNVDSLSKQMNDRLQQISQTLDHFQSIAAKIDNGQGTAGQLVNDPKLYQALVDSSRELNATIVDLKRLVEQWEQEGLHFKLSK